MNKSIQVINNLPSSENALWKSLAKLSDPKARTLVPEEFAAKYAVLPLSRFSSFGGASCLNLLCATSKPPTEELRFITGHECFFEQVEEETLKRALVAAYFDDSSKPPKDPKNFFEWLSRKALQLGASDIHIEPAKRASRILFRVDGKLVRDGKSLEPNEARALSRYLRTEAALDTTLHDIPQEGVLDRNVSGSEFRFRLSIIPSQLGPSIVLRIQGLGQVFSFAELGLDRMQIEIAEQAMRLQSGLILCAGPTGSGKSTLLYSFLSRLAEQGRKVVSIEDPVEIPIPKVTQIEVNHKGKRGYIDYLPAILRQDPEVIMIGEIRDKKTLSLAVEAGLTGHLVFSSFHGGSLKEVITRLGRLGLPREECPDVLKMVVTQRLLRTNCRHCLARETEASGLAQFFQLGEQKEPFLYSKGCSLCEHTGFLGRIGIYELHPLLSETSKSVYPLYQNLRRYLFSGKISSFTAMEALGLRPDC